MKYLITIPCVNRAERGASNVLERTFESFEKSGMFESKIKFKIVLLESGSQDTSYLDFIQKYKDKYKDKYNIDIEIHYSTQVLNGTTNTFRMFVYIKKVIDYVDYVLWMDDDVFVCKNFIENADLWIKKYAKNLPFTSLYAPYRTNLDNKHRFRHNAPIGSFFGTCCTVLRPYVADAVLKYWFLPYFDEYNYNPDRRFRDCIMKEYPWYKIFFLSFPSLVQHMNIGSTIRKNVNSRGHEALYFYGEHVDPNYIGLIYKNKIIDDNKDENNTAQEELSNEKESNEINIDINEEKTLSEEL
jgi:hypothetical protein